MCFLTGKLSVGVGPGRSQDFSKGESHCVKHYRLGVFATECCRLFAERRLTKGGHGHPQDPPRYALEGGLKKLHIT